MFLRLLSSQTLETQKESGRRVHNTKIPLLKHPSAKIGNTNKCTLLEAIRFNIQLYGMYINIRESIVNQ